MDINTHKDKRQKKAIRIPPSSIPVPFPDSPIRSRID